MSAIAENDTYAVGIIFHFIIGSGLISIELSGQVGQVDCCPGYLYVRTEADA